MIKSELLKALRAFADDAQILVSVATDEDDDDPRMFDLEDVTPTGCTEPTACLLRVRGDYSDRRFVEEEAEVPYGEPDVDEDGVPFEIE